MAHGHEAPEEARLDPRDGASAWKCARCHDPVLTTPGPLSARACDHCGGAFIPEDGTSRLLDELNLTTAELRDLAGRYGGSRPQCPGCRSKMSPLQLRGVVIEVCFGCGGLWVDGGGLEAVSSDRYRVPAPAQPSAKAAPALVPEQALVRVDERAWPRRLARLLLASAGTLGLVWTSVGILPMASWAAGALAIAGAMGLSRKQAFDVMPRARRMFRWRGFLPPSPGDDVGEAFSPDSCVVVRRVRAPALGIDTGRLSLVVVELVDAEGRGLARLHGPMLLRRAESVAPRYARALGIAVRFDVVVEADDLLDVEQQHGKDNAGLAAQDVIRVASERAPRQYRHLALKSVDAKPVGAVRTDVPSKFAPANLDAILREHFHIEDVATGQRTRLYSAVQLGKRATVIVGPDGTTLGHVSARRSLLADTFTWAGPQARRSLTARVARGTATARILDGHGRDCGALDISVAAPGEPRPLTLRMDAGRATGIARWGALALALHVSIAAAVDEL